MEVLPVDIVELLESHDLNRINVEREALKMVASINMPIFGMLRDSTPSSVYLTLHRLTKWFNKERNLEYCLCLLMLTDYISCAYNYKHFYKTFDNALTQKFMDGIFEKLCVEWQSMFKKKISDLPRSKIKIVQRFLTITGERYSDKFRFKDKLLNLADINPEYISTSIEAEDYVTLNCKSMSPMENNDLSNEIKKDNLVLAIKIPRMDISRSDRKMLAKENSYQTFGSKSIAEQTKISKQPVVPKPLFSDSETVSLKIPKLDKSREISKKMLLAQENLPRPSVSDSVAKQTVIRKQFDVRKSGFAESETVSLELPKLDVNHDFSKKTRVAQENLPKPQSVANNPMPKDDGVLQQFLMQDTTKRVIEMITIDDDIPEEDRNPSKKAKLNAFDILMRRAGPLKKKTIRLQ